MSDQPTGDPTPDQRDQRQGAFMELSAAAIEAALRAALPAAVPPALHALAQILAAVADGTVLPDAAAAHLAATPELVEPLQLLSGHTVEAAGVPLQFDGDQITVGDVSQSEAIAVGRGATAIKLTLRPDQRQGAFVSDQATVYGPVIGTNSGPINHQFVAKQYLIKPPRAPTPAAVAHATARLARLPLDTVPDVAPLPPHSRMPLRPNPVFVGRTHELRALARTLMAGTSTAAAATGMGGVGKTQLAVEFVHRYGQYFAGGVFWLSCADPAAVPAEIAACGGAAGLQLHPDFSTLALDDQVGLVQAAWAQPLPRLLVFDNCEDQALLTSWRPTSGGCRVLLTSRRPMWATTAGLHPVSVRGLRHMHSVVLLCRYRADVLPSEPAVHAIASELGDLPLALHLSGSYLERFGATLTPAAYLQQLRHPNPLALRALTGYRLEQQLSPTQHEQHVAHTFGLSYGQLQADDPIDALARRLLARAAHFAAGEPLPARVLAQTVDIELEDAAAEQDLDAALDFQEALTRLRDLGLVETKGDDRVRLHRLIAAYVRAVADDPAAQTAVEQTMLKTANALNRAGVPAPLLVLQPHLRAITEAATGRGDARAADLYTALGSHLQMIGDYVGAQPYYEQALQIREQALGPEHPATARSLNNLGMLVQDQGNLSAAKPYLERALQITEQVLGPEHPATAQSLNNLGMLVQNQGDLAGARPYLERALAICEHRLGPQHPTTITVRRNLAAIDTPPPSADQQIATIEQQAVDAVAQVRATGTAAERAALAEELEARAQWAEADKSDGSPYRALAARLRELAQHLTP